MNAQTIQGFENFLGHEVLLSKLFPSTFPLDLLQVNSDYPLSYRLSLVRLSGPLDTGECVGFGLGRYTYSPPLETLTT